MCMWMCVSVLHVCIYIMYELLCMYICVCTVYVFMYMYMYVYKMYVRKYVCTYVHCMYMSMYIHVHVCMYMYVCTCIYICMCCTQQCIIYMYMYVYRLYTCNYNSQNILVVVRLIYMKEIPFIFEARVNHCVKRKYIIISCVHILNV